MQPPRLPVIGDGGVVRDVPARDGWVLGAPLDGALHLALVQEHEVLHVGGVPRQPLQRRPASVRELSNEDRFDFFSGCCCCCRFLDSRKVNKECLGMYALKQTQLLPIFVFVFSSQPVPSTGGSGAGRGQHETRHKTLTWTRQAVAKVLLLLLQ